MKWFPENLSFDIGYSTFDILRLPPFGGAKGDQGLLFNFSLTCEEAFKTLNSADVFIRKDHGPLLQRPPFHLAVPRRNDHAGGHV
jgi:hypothetical protein